MAVVVPALDEQRSIGRCLRALANQRDARGARLSPETFEVVVVDNGSSDATVGEVLSFAAARPDLRLHLLREPRPGVGRARRSGTAWACARLGRLPAVETRCVAGTDADSRVPPTWISTMLGIFADRPEVSYAAGAFAYEDKRALDQLRQLRLVGDTWGRLMRLLAPVRGVETVGCNYGVRLSCMLETDGVPLLTVGEDLAIGETLRARGKIGVWMPLTVITSARRAIADPLDFLTGYRRVQAWGSRGRQRFRGAPRDDVPSVPGRVWCAARLAGADLEGAQSEVCRRQLHYYVLQHLVKPLVLVEQLRGPALEDMLGIGRADFDAALARARRRCSLDDPYYLEDLILAVDDAVHEQLYAALVSKLETVDLDGTSNDRGGGLPFHCSPPPEQRHRAPDGQPGG